MYSLWGIFLNKFKLFCYMKRLNRKESLINLIECLTDKFPKRSEIADCYRIINPIFNHVDDNYSFLSSILVSFNKKTELDLRLPEHYGILMGYIRKIEELYFQEKKTKLLLEERPYYVKEFGNKYKRKLILDTKINFLKNETISSLEKLF